MNTENDNDNANDNKMETKEDDQIEIININQELEKQKTHNEESSNDKSKFNEDNNIHLNKKNKERSPFLLTGAKLPLSIYTRRVFDVSLIKNYLNEDSNSGICGNQNLGNTCFMNSALSCLSNCTELTYYFISEQYKQDINYESKYGLKGKLAEEWGELLNKYWRESSGVANPQNLKYVIGEKDSRFRGYQQHDSNEFINIFLDCLNEDLNNITEKKYIELQEKSSNEKDEECALRFWNANLSRNDSVITDLFCGLFKSTITCPKCNFVSITFEPFYSINLPLKERKKKKKQINKINYNEYKIIYVPKYEIRTTLSISFINIPNTTSVNECIDIIKNNENFKYKNIFKNVEGFKINKQISQGELDKDEYIDAENEIFLYEIISEYNNELKIPIYFVYMKKDRTFDLSLYPRYIFGDRNMMISDLRKSIYILIRKYILSPFKKKEERIDFLSKEISRYRKDFTVEDNYIFILIEAEYEKIFEEVSDNDLLCLKEFLYDMPFTINLRELEGNTIIPIFEEKNLNELSAQFKELTNVIDINTCMNEFMSKINDFVLSIDFNFDSKFINKQNYKFNSYISEAIQFQNKVEEKTEEEKESEAEKEENKKQNLVECIKYFCEEEQLKIGNEWYCNKCKENLLAKKKIDLYYLPKILIINFKRFIKESQRWEKNDENIDFPITNFNMKELIIGPDKEHSVYDLFAVSQHYGNTEGGHYTAVCKNGNNWYNYDDSSVIKTNPLSCLSSSAYVLFYRRQTD